MSIIAIRWAYSQPIKNAIEKSILVFLCTHDFPGNVCTFKIETICGAVSCSKDTAINALKRLHEQKYISKQTRFAEDGRQLPNGITVLVPQQYVQKFCDDYELSTGGVDLTPPSPPRFPPPSGGGKTPPLKVQSIKLNVKKSFCLSDEQKKRKAENEKKHDFAKPPMASVETQSTSYNPNKPRSEKVSPLLEKYRKEQDAKTSKPIAKPANELPTGTEIPAEIPRKGHNGGQGAAIASDRGEGNPSNFRGRYGLLAACSSRLHSEEAGVAGDERTSAHTTQTG